jgi:hypothetical protein
MSVRHATCADGALQLIEGTWNSRQGAADAG